MFKNWVKQDFLLAITKRREKGEKVTEVDSRRTKWVPFYLQRVLGQFNLGLSFPKKFMALFLNETQ